MAHFAGKGTASGEEAKGTISERVSSNGGRATEALRKHRSAVGGVGRSSAAVVQMARSTGPGWHQRRTAAGEPARIHTPQRGQPAKATAGREDLGGGFFQRYLAKSRGSTPEARYHWREGIYDQIRGMMSMQGSLSI